MSIERVSHGFGKMRPGTMGGQSRAASPAARSRRIAVTSAPPPSEFYDGDTSEVTTSSNNHLLPWAPSILTGSDIKESPNFPGGDYWQLNVDGDYAMEAVVTWPDVATGNVNWRQRQTSIVIRDADTLAFIEQATLYENAAVSGDTTQTVTHTFTISGAPRVVDVGVYQNTGGPMTVTNASFHILGP